MSSLFRLFTVAAFIATSSISIAVAQPSDVGPESSGSDDAVPERVITITEPESLSAEPHRPGEELIQVGPELDASELLPNRTTFVDRLVESASDI